MVQISSVQLHKTVLSDAGYRLFPDQFIRSCAPCSTALVGLYLGWNKIPVSQIGNILYNKLTTYQGVIAVRSSYKIYDLSFVTKALLQT